VLVGSSAGCRRGVDPLYVLVEHSPGAEAGSERADRRADAGEPGAREPVRVALIKVGQDLLLEQVLQGGGVTRVLRPVVGVDLA
jgi:hypothetical protein